MDDGWYMKTTILIMNVCFFQWYERPVQSVDQGAGVWLVGGLWTGPVRQSDQTVGGKRADTAVSHASGFRKGQREKSIKYDRCGGFKTSQVRRMWDIDSRMAFPDLRRWGWGTRCTGRSCSFLWGHSALRRWRSLLSWTTSGSPVRLFVIVSLT